jgi:AAA family ATP:ADP antiporter
MENNKEFGRIRKVIFPIYKEELRKFIPLTSIFFIISFNYSVLRSLKDMFIMNHAGAEMIYYLKLVGVTPAIILFTIFYNKISRVVDRDNRFNIMIAYFLVIFGICYFFLLPNLETLKLNDLADRLQDWSPKLLGLWEAIRYWPLSLLYINAEAWGTFALGIIFWTFVNEITSAKQAKRFYSFLSLGASIGLITAGTLLKTFKKDTGIMLGFVVGLIVILLAVYNLFARDIKHNPSLYQVEEKPKKKKAKMSFGESLKFLFRSNYLMLIAVLVIAYGTVISLFESAWKSEIKALLDATGDKTLSADIYGEQGIYGGIVSILLTVFLSAPIMNKGWRFAASVTPVVTIVATVLFFSFLYFQDSDFLSSVTHFFGVTPVYMAVMFGLGNVVFIKSAKYILFDPTKERAYIPLDEELKVRGKAAVDGVGSRLGKSLGSFILTVILLPLFGGGLIQNVQYHIFFIIILLLIAWLVAVKKLGVKFDALTADEKEK